MDFKKVALKYLNAGFSVIPVSGKRPTVDWKEYQTRKPTEEEITEWSTKYSGMGIVTGEISGITVVDIDVKSGGLETLKTLGLPITWTVKTGGGGWHYYYKHNEHIGQTSGVYQGVDIRNDGGYVVAPPSMHQSGNRYEWMYKEGELVNFPMDLFKFKREKKDWSQFLQLGVNTGSRNDSAASLFGKLMTLFEPEQWRSVVWEIANYWNERNKPPLSTDELRIIFDSISKKAIQNVPISIEKTLEENESVLDIAKSLKQRNEVKKVFHTWGNKQFDDNFPLLQPHTYMILFGQFSSGKTTFAMYLAKSNSNKKVCFLTLEMSKEKVIEQYVYKRAGVTKENYRRGEFNSSVYEEYAKEIKDIQILGITEGERKRGYTLSDIEEILKTTKPDILIIDNFNKLATQKDPSVSTDNDTSSQLLFLARKYPVLLVLIHHANKPSAEKKEVLRGISGLRGTNKLNDDADIVCELGRPKKGDPSFIPNESKIGIYKDRDWDAQGIHSILFCDGDFIPIGPPQNIYSDLTF